MVVTCLMRPSQTRLSGLGWLGAAARLTKVFTSVTSPSSGAPLQPAAAAYSGDMDTGMAAAEKNLHWWVVAW